MDPRAANTVVFANHFAMRYPQLAATLCTALAMAGIQRVQVATRNIWPRDYLPVQMPSGALVKFGYRGYGHGFKAYPWLRVNRKLWAFLGKEVQYCDLVLDGGNVVRCGDRVCLTEIVFRHNPGVARAALLARLERLLEAQIVLLPVEPGDDIGHTDGILQPIPGTREVLLHDYRRAGTKAYARYAERVERALTRAGFECHPFPYAYAKRPRITEREFRRQFPLADSFNPAFGYYANFLIAGRALILPRFGLAEDDEALALVHRHFPAHTLTTVDCSRLSLEGGLVHCATMDYRL